MDSKAECYKLNLTHETKTSKRHRPLSLVQVPDTLEGSAEGIRRLYRKGFVKGNEF